MDITTTSPGSATDPPVLHRERSMMIATAGHAYVGIPRPGPGVPYATLHGCPPLTGGICPP